MRRGTVSLLSLNPLAGIYRSLGCKQSGEDEENTMLPSGHCDIGRNTRTSRPCSILEWHKVSSKNWILPVYTRADNEKSGALVSHI